MSSARSLAKTYLRYWWKTSTGDWTLADNAPASIRTCVRTLPKSITVNMAYEACCIVAGQAAHPRFVVTMLQWLSLNPAAIAHCDAAMLGKQPPRTLADLVEKAYRAELLVARNHIATCLERELLT